MIKFKDYYNYVYRDLDLIIRNNSDKQIDFVFDVSLLKLCGIKVKYLKTYVNKGIRFLVSKNTYNEIELLKEDNIFGKQASQIIEFINKGYLKVQKSLNKLQNKKQINIRDNYFIVFFMFSPLYVRNITEKLSGVNFTIFAPDYKYNYSSISNSYIYQLSNCRTLEKSKNYYRFSEFAITSDDKNPNFENALNYRNQFIQGGEGVIVEEGDIISKHYEYQYNIHKLNKIEKLIKFSSEYGKKFSDIVFPKNAIQENMHKKLLGVQMQNIKNAKTMREAFNDPEFEKNIYDNSSRLIIKLCTNILKMNLLDIVISDFSTDNILLSKNGDIKFIDIDSVQLLNYPSATFRRDFASYDDSSIILQNSNMILSYLRSSYSDAYALSVIVYMIFFNGTSPLISNEEGIYQEPNILDGVYKFKGNVPNNNVQFDEYNIWYSLNDRYKEFFNNVFCSIYDPSIGSIIETFFKEEIL